MSGRVLFVSYRLRKIFSQFTEIAYFIMDVNTLKISEEAEIKIPMFSEAEAVKILWNAGLGCDALVAYNLEVLSCALMKHDINLNVGICMKCLNDGRTLNEVAELNKIPVIEDTAYGDLAIMYELWVKNANQFKAERISN